MIEIIGRIMWGSKVLGYVIRDMNGNIGNISHEAALVEAKAKRIVNVTASGNTLSGTNGFELKALPTEKSYFAPGADKNKIVGALVVRAPSHPDTLYHLVGVSVSTANGVMNLSVQEAHAYLADKAQTRIIHHMWKAPCTLEQIAQAGFGKRPLLLLATFKDSVDRQVTINTSIRLDKNLAEVLEKYVSDMAACQLNVTGTLQFGNNYYDNGAAPYFDKSIIGYEIINSGKEIVIPKFRFRAGSGGVKVYDEITIPEGASILPRECIVGSGWPLGRRIGILFNSKLLKGNLAAQDRRRNAVDFMVELTHNTFIVGMQNNICGGALKQVGVFDGNTWRLKDEYSVLKNRLGIIPKECINGETASHPVKAIVAVGKTGIKKGPAETKDTPVTKVNESTASGAAFRQMLDAFKK